MNDDDLRALFEQRAATNRPRVDPQGPARVMAQVRPDDRGRDGSWWRASLVPLMAVAAVLLLVLAPFAWRAIVSGGDPQPVRPPHPPEPFNKTSVAALKDDCGRALTGGAVTEAIAARSTDRSVAAALVRNESQALMCLRYDANSSEGYLHQVTINATPANDEDLTISTLAAPHAEVYVTAAVVPKIAFITRTYDEAESADGTDEVHRRGNDTLALNLMTFTGPPPPDEVDLTVFWFPDKIDQDCGCEEPLTTIPRTLASIPLGSPTSPIP